MATQIVLIVEDSETEQYVLQELLKKFDYNCQVVSSGEEAITAIGVTYYAAILMDLSLPGIDGLECSQRIRRIELEAGRRTPIIAVTATIDQDTRNDCLAAGMDDYLSKPFEPDDLRRMLLRYVYDPNQPNLKTLTPMAEDAISIDSQ